MYLEQSWRQLVSNDFWHLGSLLQAIRVARPPIPAGRPARLRRSARAARDVLEDRQSDDAPGYCCCCSPRSSMHIPSRDDQAFCLHCEVPERDAPGTIADRCTDEVSVPVASQFSLWTH